MALQFLLFFSVALWHVIGAVQLFPKKLWLMKRLGHLTSEEIIQLGKASDAEVQSLRKGTWMRASTA